VVESGKVGPEANASSLFSGTSETNRETCRARLAASASRQVFANGVDLGDGRAGVHQGVVGRDQFRQRHRPHGLFHHGGTAAADQEDDQRLFGNALHGAQNGVGGAQRAGIGQRMPAAVIFKARQLVGRVNHGGHHPADHTSQLRPQSRRQGVGGFPDANGDDTVVIGQVVQIVRDAQHLAFVLHLAIEGGGNRTLIQGVPEDPAQPVARVEGLSRSIGVGHELNYGRFGAGPKNLFTAEYAKDAEDEFGISDLGTA